jgi:hypothetical protein
VVHNVNCLLKPTLTKSLLFHGPLLMPLGWMLLAVALFAGAMLALKFSAAAAVSAWGAWVGIPIIAIFLFIAVLIDRSDKKKRDRIND